MFRKENNFRKLHWKNYSHYITSSEQSRSTETGEGLCAARPGDAVVVECEGDERNAGRLHCHVPEETAVLSIRTMAPGTYAVNVAALVDPYVQPRCYYFVGRVEVCTPCLALVLPPSTVSQKSSLLASR